MNDAPQERPLVIRRTLRAPIERVFDAFVVPELRKQWWFPEEGMACDQCEIDARPGGAYRVRMQAPHLGQSFECQGEFHEVDAPRRLVFTWVWEHERSSGVPLEEVTSLVEVDFREVAEGTELRITHSRFPNPGEAEGYGQGWEGCLDSLERSLGGRSS